MKNIRILLISTALLGACATDSGNTSADARGRATNQALKEAGGFIGRAAVSALFTVASEELSGGKVDFASAASEGLWKNAGSIASSGAVERIVAAYSGNKLPKTAEMASRIAAQAGTSPVVTNTIASIISTAAGSPP